MGSGQQYHEGATLKAESIWGIFSDHERAWEKDLGARFSQDGKLKLLTFELVLNPANLAGRK
jgi:hypothetical protein